MKNISIRRALATGWGKFVERPWYLLGVLLTFTVLFVIGSGNAVVAAVAYILYAGYIAMMIRHYRGEKVELDDLFSIDSRWIYFVFLTMVKTVLIILGLLCFIIPGIYLAVRWMFAEILVLDKGMRPMEALRASSTLTEGYRGHLFFFSVVAAILGIIGFFLIVIGAFVASLVTLFATIYLYERLRAIKEM